MKFDSLKTNENENIVEYSLRVNEVENMIRGLNEELKYEILVQKVSRSLLMRFNANISNICNM